MLTILNPSSNHSMTSITDSLVQNLLESQLPVDRFTPFFITAKHLQRQLRPQLFRISEYEPVTIYLLYVKPKHVVSVMKRISYDTICN